jgi:hypothetical protein
MSTEQAKALLHQIDSCMIHSCHAQNLCDHCCELFLDLVDWSYEEPAAAPPVVAPEAPNEDEAAMYAADLAVVAPEERPKCLGIEAATGLHHYGQPCPAHPNAKSCESCGIRDAQANKLLCHECLVHGVLQPRGITFDTPKPEPECRWSAPGSASYCARPKPCPVHDAKGGGR